MSIAFPDLHATLLRWYDDVGPQIRSYFTRAEAGELKGDEAIAVWSSDIMEAPFRSSQWADVQMAIRAYPSLRSQIEGGRIESRVLGHAFINAADRRFRDNEPLPLQTDVPWFDSIYNSLELYFSSDDVRYRITIPLQGLACESREIVFSDHARIVRLTDEDLRDEEQRGVHHVVSDPARSYPEELHYALQVIMNVPKSLTTEQAGELGAKYEAWRSATLRAITSVLPNHARSEGLLVEPEGWCPTKWLQATIPAVIFRRWDGGKTMLKRDSEEFLRQSWAKFAEESYVRRFPDLILATDRLTKADSETDAPDRLVDLVIAIEALLSRGEGTTDELPYRLSIRAARFVAHDLGERERRVFDIVRQAFRTRNKVLRSIGVSPTDYSALGVSSLDEFADHLERIVRAALHKIISSSKATTIDWRELTMSGPG